MKKLFASVQQNLNRLTKLYIKYRIVISLFNFNEEIKSFSII